MKNCLASSHGPIDLKNLKIFVAVDFEKQNFDRNDYFDTFLVKHEIWRSINKHFSAPKLANL